ncbi:unnamed protein product [Paramecium octaurelia]|uniref:Aminoglycoside phosphotransferase domain-containing protein n=1 Tax=Paramecium octaurelia TaxID=43137 RepID=A0A8S1YH59_PAROT|nr:unnamed protein product [Paramecium octaurelia]
MNQELLLKFFNDEPFKSERMCGLTNFVYKVSTAKESVIYRRYTSTFRLFQNREREVRFQQELAQLELAPKVLYSDNLQRIEEYWPYSPVTLSEIKEDYIEVARMLGSFHKLRNRNSFVEIFDTPSIYQWLHNVNLRDEIFDVITDCNCQKLYSTFEQVFSDQNQTFILGLFKDPSFSELPLVIAHNDLNATNFLKDKRLMKYHLIDFEFAGLNYPGYELANFFNEMEWDYTFSEPPYFKIKEGWQEDLKLNFIKEYWKEYANSDEIPKALLRQIEIGGILQNYFWMLIGGLSLKQEQQGIDLVYYVNRRMTNFNKVLNLTQ